MKLREKITLWWKDIQPLLLRLKEVLANRRGEGTEEGIIEVFNVLSQVLIGGKIYLIERHFTEERDVREAIYTAVKNEAFRVFDQRG